MTQSKCAMIRMASYVTMGDTRGKAKWAVGGRGLYLEGEYTTGTR